MASGGLKLATSAALLGAMLWPFAAASPSEAASRLCRQLEAQLASASSGGGASPGQVRKYDEAIARQSQEIAKARNRGSDAGCGFSLFRNNLSECAAINTALDRMSANLDALQAKRAKLAVGGSSRRDKARIMASIDANGCRDEQVAAKRPSSIVEPQGTGSLYDQLFGKDTTQAQTLASLDLGDDGADDQASDDQYQGQPNHLIIPTLGGSFHTVCVRTCDGYFYPMSTAATLSDFQRDQKNCESSCPGTDMQVFYTRQLDDDSATMTSSADGRAYSDLPTAYLYKNPKVSQPLACGCNAVTQRGFSIIGGNAPSAPQSEAPAEQSSMVPVPAQKPDPADDPETLANRDGGLDLETIRRLAAKPDGATAARRPDGKVRVVGPAFLPAPEEAIDLRAPAQKKVQ